MHHENTITNYSNLTGRPVLGKGRRELGMGVANRRRRRQTDRTRVSPPPMCNFWLRPWTDAHHRRLYVN